MSAGAVSNIDDFDGGEGLEVRDLSVLLNGRSVLGNLSLSVQRGEILALLGPSGCGKTTLLRTIAGLQPTEAGSISWAGENQGSVPAHRRHFGMVFQDHALLPHRNVGANVAFGLRMQRVPAPERRQQVAAMLQLVGLEGYERRSVTTLSGGEAKRVALARALVPQPKLLLADEPFAALDRPLRDRLVADVRRILLELNQTAIHVTHDHAEAFALADRVALMHSGRIHRTATPQELSQDPRDSWTATFLGLGVIWPLSGAAATPNGPTSDRIYSPWGSLELSALAGDPPKQGSADLCLLIRPEAVQAHPQGSLQATVTDVRVEGNHNLASLQFAEAPPLRGYVPADVTSGSHVRLSLDPAGVTLITGDSSGPGRNSG